MTLAKIFDFENHPELTSLEARAEMSEKNWNAWQDNPVFSKLEKSALETDDRMHEFRRYLIKNGYREYWDWQCRGIEFRFRDEFIMMQVVLGAPRGILA